MTGSIERGRDSFALEQLRSTNPYPGRGVIAATFAGGLRIVGYFATGRSAASQARVLQASADGTRISLVPRGLPFDELRHYEAAVVTRGTLFVGNGDHVAQVETFTRTGRSEWEALASIAYEPDPPLFTPRIFGVFPTAQTLKLGAARRHSASETPERWLSKFPWPSPGFGLLLTTYKSDGASFLVGPPAVPVKVSASSEEQFLESLWGCLDERFRVAALTYDLLEMDRGPLAMSREGGPSPVASPP